MQIRKEFYSSFKENQNKKNFSSNDTKDIDRKNQNGYLDQLMKNMAAKKRMIQIQQEDNESESKVQSEEKYNLTTPELEDKLKYNENYEVNVEKDAVNSEVYKTEDEEDEEDFNNEINDEESVGVMNKVQQPTIEPEIKKKFFEIYKSVENAQGGDRGLLAIFDSVYNTANLNINIKPSKNQYIKIYDDMIENEIDNSIENMTALRIKIFDFMKMNPISIDVGDMIIRLGMKHLTLDPIDNKGAIECYQVALKIYSQIHDNMIIALQSEKGFKGMGSKKFSDLGVTGDDKSMNNPSVYMNNSNLLNVSTPNAHNDANPYKFRAVKIRQSETLRKLADCYITEMDTASAHKNIEMALKNYFFLYGEKSKELADSIFKKGYITQIEKRWKDATELYNMALGMYLHVFKYTNVHFSKMAHMEVADCYFRLGLIKEKLKNFNLSLQYYQMALEIYRNYFKDDINEECALCLYNIGLLYEIQDYKDKALKSYTDVKNIYAKLKSDSQDCIDNLIKTSNLSIHFKNYQDAAVDLLEALEATVKKNKCENLSELLEMLLIQIGTETQFDLYSFNADLVEICFLLSKIYSIPEYKKHQEGFEILKIVLALMPPERDFIEETYNVLKKLLENLTEENYDSSWEDEIVDCITHFIAKLDLETEAKKIMFETDYDSVSNDTSKTGDGYNKSEQKEQPVPSESDDDSFSYTPKLALKNAYIIKQAEVLQNLAKNCSRIKLYRSSVELYLKCLVYLENVEDDPSTKMKICDFMNQIALEYTNLNNFEAATKFFEKTLELRLKVNGPGDLKTAGAYNNLAVSYNRIGDNLKALEYWQLGMEIKKNNISDSEDPRIAKDYYNFSLILLRMKEYDKAIHYMIEALYTFDKKLGKNSQFSADACLLLGELYKNLANYNAALQYCSRAMTYFGEKFGDSYPNTIKSRLLFAICLSMTFKYDKAIIIFKPVIEAFLNKEEINHSSLFVESLYEYSKCLDWKSKYDEALKYFQIFVESAGEDWDEERLIKVGNKIAQLVKNFLIFLEVVG